MLNKKAMTVGFIVALMITLVSFVLIAGTITKFMGKADEKAAEELCHDSIALRVKTALNLGTAQINSVPLLCKTIDKKASGSKEAVEKEIAQKVARTWWIFGEGKYEELLKSGFSSALPEFKTTNDCFLAYNFMIDSNEFDSISPMELTNYLMNQKYNKDTSYLNYVQYVGGPGRVIIIGDIKPNHAYGISFGAKNKEGVNNLGWKSALTIGGGALAAGGAYLTGTIVGATAGIPMVILGVASGLLGELYFVGDTIKALSTDRDVSTIYIRELNESQNLCFKGDLAGE